MSGVRHVLDGLVGGQNPWPSSGWVGKMCRRTSWIHVNRWACECRWGAKTGGQEMGSRGHAGGRVSGKLGERAGLSGRDGERGKDNCHPHPGHLTPLLAPSWPPLPDVDSK